MIIFLSIMSNTTSPNALLNRDHNRSLLSSTYNLFVAVNTDSNKLRDFLRPKIAKRRNQIHPGHNPRFNHDVQLQIDCREWVLENIEINKIPNDRPPLLQYFRRSKYLNIIGVRELAKTKTFLP
jgi:hypothetical protein